MSRKLCVKGPHTAVFLSIALFFGFTELGHAADALDFFKNYFVTGDYVAAGVGLRGTGKSVADPCLDQGVPGTQPCPINPSWSGSYAKNIIQISGLPVTNGIPADIVAAFLYWQSDEPATAKTSPMARRGVIDGHPIVGAVVPE